MSDIKRVGIVVGGGPAPGINSVIGAATIRSELGGADVVGIRDGFSGLMHGKIDNVEPLDIAKISRIHFQGGSYLRTSRANPTRNPAHLDATVRSLKQLGVDGLISIGGDDTAFSAMSVAGASGGDISVVHVPKTIDNDLVLQPGADTFGYQTARHVGSGLVKNLMVDASTTSRWYFAIAMGRKAGHLALGIGKAAGATLTLIPEEFGDGVPSLDMIADTLAGAIIKRRAAGHNNGVAVIAEGVILGFAETAEDVERDEHGHVRLSEVPLGGLLKKAVKKRLAELGIDLTIVDTNLGYELRCADPIPWDLEYTRDLGYLAAKYLLEGGSNVMVTMQHSHFIPIPFSQLIDPDTGKTRVRMVDMDSAGYAIARRYMIRLRRDDFTDDATLADIAAASGLSVHDFRSQFQHVVEAERPNLEIEILR